MHRIPDSQIVVQLLGRTRTALGLTQGELADLLGVARRTISRWEARAGSPSADQLRQLARAVHAKDAALAAEIAVEGDASLEALGLRSTAAMAPPAGVSPTPSSSSGAAARPFPPIDLLIDSIVHVAAQTLEDHDAAHDSIGTVTAVLRTSFARASALGLTVAEVDRALSPRAAIAVAPEAPKRERSRAPR